MQAPQEMASRGVATPSKSLQRTFDPRCRFAVKKACVASSASEHGAKGNQKMEADARVLS